jgi:hypothetical protein
MMNRSALHKRYSLLAVLLLCLSGSLWMQANHVHLTGHSTLHECVVCHYSAAAALNSHSSSSITITPVASLELAIILFAVVGPQLRPPARAPPVYLAA